jgi:hypothetical protein
MQDQQYVTMAGWRVGPGRGWYGLAAAVLAVGVILAGLLGYRGVRGIRAFADHFVRVVVPGSADLALAEPGTYTVYHEYRSVVNGTVFDGPQDLPGLLCGLRAKETGAAVPLSPSTTSEAYTVGSRAGVSVGRFSVERPGTYELACRDAAGQAGQRTVLAVGRSDLFSHVLTIIAAVGVFIVAAGIAAAVFTVTFNKRQRASQPVPGRNVQTCREVADPIRPIP